MNTLARFLTPERRQLIQAFLVALAPLFIMFGYGTDGTWEQVLIISGAVLGAVASFLSLLNVRVADWATQGWAIVRATIYGLGTVVSPSLVLLGFYDDATNTQILTGLSLALTALSAAIAIFANGRQQLVVAEAMTPGTLRRDLKEE
ncbi:MULTISPECIES: hypothetical protein [unclassified Microbacterium]|uniref:hypothetical protein n=1 Tax=unclassified Microbacterium TaxID=2609290 RepID=UPI0016050D49|nr:MULTISPECIES: hypothetical protein [unclassified Microbacterium]QNA93272.1 hypothetical protein G4G29_14810 [Microbacterium sp. Se63.02b]QYM63482.1 hypothetical protein K1X59_14860 [Microbacterium sp. Se5.02b]